jgi:polysaccharide biosynthesis protein PslH
MHILFLTQIIPYPPDAGPKVKTWNVLRYLVNQGHRVTLASFIRPEEKPYLNAVKEICSEVYTIEIHRSRLADIRFWLRSHFTGRPFLIERDDISEMRELVQTLLISDAIDIIHADQLTMCQYALQDQEISLVRDNVNQKPHPVRIFDAHNAVWTIVERMGQNAPYILKKLANLEAHRVKKYEGMIVKCFEHTLVVSTQDSHSLLEAVEAIDTNRLKDQIPITVIPIAIDTQLLQPVNRINGSRNIVTMGTLHYPPNADGIRWFILEVFPIIKQKIPDASLTIIGKNPPGDFIKIAQQQPDSITVTGYVPDLTPYLEKAEVMVIPVRAGGGMRVRILEAFARGMPVVTTTVGIEGIEAIPDEEVVIKDTPSEFAQAVVNLLNNRNNQDNLASKGRQLAEARYDWKVVLEKLDVIYSKN